MIASREQYRMRAQERVDAENAERSPAPFWMELERVYRRLAREADANLDLPVHLLAEPEGWNPAEKLRETFALSDFELDVLLLCAGAAVDRRFGDALIALQPDMPAPAFGLAAAVLEKPHWSALSRLRPLRYWRLVEFAPGPPLQAALTIDERILQYLLGVSAADERMEMIFHPLAIHDARNEEGSARLASAAAHGELHWRRATRSTVVVTGEGSERMALFQTMCRQAGLRAWVMDAGDLPDSPVERERLARAYNRENALWPSALLIHTERLDHAEALNSWLRRINAPVAVDVEAGSAAERISGLRLAAPSMNTNERKAEWQRFLGPVAATLDGMIDAVAEAFALDEREIRETAEAIEEEAALGGEDAEALKASTWRLCRTAARRLLDELAARVENIAAWDELVLPEAQTQMLKQIAMHARHASRVNGEWGFAQRYGRGLGLSALFTGPSGTGKTMAAGVLARELDRDLYQIDLATVVSKYIGETEKHLRRIFDAAERSGAILLFDEADALFGKRSQVRDSHDRYANLEISYLLQRMESYRGIAILTTNMQNALDPAFQRRLRFVVQFPFPDSPSRERIWRKVFPAGAPLAQLAFERLAQLNVTGGSIRNIALLAAFLAADSGAAIGMRHILDAARTEYTKLDKPLSAAESKGWE
jgi:SpoVK/Ycf46/Vps4 family AAA+-type ATPase